MDMQTPWLYYGIFVGLFSQLQADISHLNHASAVLNTAQDSASLRHSREKRNLFQLKQMTECLTGKTALDFVGYGCFCGMGGSGNPVDEIDRCCKKHDECYEVLANSRLCGSSSALDEYITSYRTVNCSVCAPLQSYGHDEFAQCRSQLCQCDATLVRCIKNHQENFKRKFMGHDKSKCK